MRTPALHTWTLAARRLLGSALCSGALLSGLLWGMVPRAGAAPYTPADDSVVLLTLPTLLTGANSAESRRAERSRLADLRRQPHNLPLALARARQAIDRARLNGDPRELGQAQAALAPWWALPAPPPAVRLLRATVRQGQHDFSLALTDLDALTGDAQAPWAVRAQAELTRAAVLQVQGRLAEAHAGCTRLGGPAYAALGAALQTTARACLAELASLQGDAANADAELARLARDSQGQGGDAAWLALLRAELAERRGRPEAGALYRAATAGQPGAYALAAYADWLLAQHREREVLALLAGREEADALLLRLAIARHRLHDPRAANDIAQLQARFDAARARGDTTHGREQSRFALELQGDAATALALAQANWAAQKEPADALSLLHAATAAGQPEAAETVRAWARSNRYSDARWPRAMTPLREPT